MSVHICYPDSDVREHGLPKKHSAHIPAGDSLTLVRGLSTVRTRIFKMLSYH